MAETAEARELRTGLSSLEMTDQESAAVQKTPNRVTLASIKDKIETVEYINPHQIPHMTIAVAITSTGFAVVGTSAPADKDNFDAALGQKFAFEDVVRQMWRLEGYALRDRLAREGTPEPQLA